MSFRYQHQYSRNHNRSSYSTYHSNNNNRYNNHNRGGRRPYFRDIDYSKMSRNEVIEDLVKVEKHHIFNTVRNEESGRVEEVFWCPGFMVKDQHCAGGTQLFHHQCRQCKKLAIHLVDTKGRPCLACYGWSRRDIPHWYYHHSCSNCRR